MLHSGLARTGCGNACVYWPRYLSKRSMGDRVEGVAERIAIEMANKADMPLVEYMRPSRLPG